MVSVPRASVALDTSTTAPHLSRRSRPMMQGSWMLANQNWCCLCWPPTITRSDLVPIILERSPVTVVVHCIVGVHPRGSDLLEFGRMPGRTREIVDLVSTRARQGTPSRAQSRYNPCDRPRRPTCGEKELGVETTLVGNSSPALLPRSSLTTPPITGSLVLELVCFGRCGQEPRTCSSIRQASSGGAAVERG